MLHHKDITKLQELKTILSKKDITESLLYQQLQLKTVAKQIITSPLVFFRFF